MVMNTMSKEVFKPLKFEDSGLNKKEWGTLEKLSNHKKIQDFLNALKFNFEKHGQTHTSVRETLRRKEAHCLEGALVAGVALWIQGERPLVLDLVSARPDMDHLVVVFKRDGLWGAISKTNHAVLRYREPVYKTIRELAMSYFHEYFLFDGTKTLRKFSTKPFDLSTLGTEWLTSKENLAYIAHMIDETPHTEILNHKQIINLRKADKIEIKAGKLTEY